jgi:hypothetical protein
MIGDSVEVYAYPYVYIDKILERVCMCVTCAKSRKDSLVVALASALDLLADVPSLRQHNHTSISHFIFMLKENNLSLFR